MWREILNSVRGRPGLRIDLDGRATIRRTLPQGRAKYVLIWGVFTLTKQPQDIDRTGQAGDGASASQDAARQAVEITPAMVEAGRVALAEFAPLGDIDENSLLLVGMVREVLIAALGRR
jgi:hypothetical protein